MASNYTKIEEELREYWAPLVSGKGLFFTILAIAIIIFGIGYIFGGNLEYGIFLITVALIILLFVYLTSNKRKNTVDKVIDQYKRNGQWEQVLLDYSKGVHIMEDSIILGNVYIVGKSPKKTIRYEDIVQVYQYVHKTNFVEDRRILRVVNKEKKVIDLVALKVRGKSDEELKKILFVIVSKNPQVKLGYR